MVPSQSAKIQKSTDPILIFFLLKKGVHVKAAQMRGQEFYVLSLLFMFFFQMNGKTLYLVDTFIISVSLVPKLLHLLHYLPQIQPIKFKSAITRIAMKKVQVKLILRTPTYPSQTNIFIFKI